MSKKASEQIRVYQTPGSPVISNVGRRIIEKDGLYFKDIDGSGEVTAVNDWRLFPAERANAYVKTLTMEEKLGQLFISQGRMGMYATPSIYVWASRWTPRWMRLVCWTKPK